MAAAQVVLRNSARGTLVAVINATGVVLHTNLGRAPLGAEARAAVERAGSGYSSLEFDLETGDRGSRHVHAAARLRRLTGAEDALVANNAAAALTLSLAALAGRDAGRPASVVVSRGELVEIGGSFRVHDIMARSGAVLREVGSTNRTHASDYENAIGANSGALLKVHRSNFALEGFVAEVPARALAAIARARSIPLLHDLGSGLMMSLASIGLRGEPTASEALNDGADIVIMSGDKLLGGPQAGIILGRKELLSRMRSNPLARSYRVDKFTLAALEATLALYRDPARALELIPTLSMLAESRASIAARANDVLHRLECDAHVSDSIATVGAGAFPSAKLESAAIVFHGSAERWSVALRAAKAAVVGRIANDTFMLDFRAINPSEHDFVVESVNHAAGSVRNA